MTAEDWVALSPWISVAAVIVSLTSCAIAFKVAQTHSRVADFNHCFEVWKQLRDAVRSAHELQGDAQERAIRDLLNLTEILALVVNDGRIGPSARHIARQHLVETWAWFQTAEGLADIVDRSITSPTTFEQLQRFKKTNRAAIDSLAKAMQQQVTSH